MFHISRVGGCSFETCGAKVFAARVVSRVASVPWLARFVWDPGGLLHLLGMLAHSYPTCQIQQFNVSHLFIRIGEYWDQSFGGAKGWMALWFPSFSSDVKGILCGPCS